MTEHVAHCNWPSRAYKASMPKIRTGKPPQVSFEPYQILGTERAGRLICLCDHASNHVPEPLPARLGLSQGDIERHIAYDVGAAGVTRALAEHLDRPAVLSNFSRLVIDPNRGSDDPTLLMRLYDGSIIPANRDADETEKQRRLDQCYRPYDDAIARTISAVTDPVLISIHSFTPQLSGRPKRPWHVAALYAEDTRLAHPFLDQLRSQPDWVVGDNEPYTGRLGGDAMDRHGLQHKRPHVLIEIRNDLICEEQDQQAWAARLAPLLQNAVKLAGV